MFNRRISLMGVAAMALGAGFAFPNRAPVAPGLDAGAGLPGGKRSRGRQAKPRKRPNMNHVSKRVRRKHRRAKR